MTVEDLKFHLSGIPDNVIVNICLNNCMQHFDIDSISRFNIYNYDILIINVDGPDCSEM